MIAIPAIDLIDNQVVRLFQGDYKQQTNYPLNPVEYARSIKAAGLDFLHLVDLSGAKQGALVHTHVLKEIVAQTKLHVDFGGGVKTEADLISLFEAGAKQVVLGSLCVKETATVIAWLKKYGTDRFVLALDTDGKQLKINGWQDGGGITLNELLQQFIDFEGLTILTTDIRRDGTGTGPSLELYETFVKTYPNHRWIASGGVESMSDLQALRTIGCYGCVVGKALLEGKITLNELKEFNDGGI